MADDSGWRDADEPATDEDARADGQGPLDPGPDPAGDGQAPPEEGAVAGSFSPDVGVVPETPDPENVAFVALGVYVTIVAVGRMLVGPVMYEPATLGAVTLAVATVTALLYGFFVRTDR